MGTRLAGRLLPSLALLCLATACGGRAAPTDAAGHDTSTGRDATLLDARDAPSCLDGPACVAPVACCWNGCRDVLSDPANCGGCAQSCGNAMACRNGQCVCGDGGACAGTLQCCGGQCVDLAADTNNCGLCGNRCGQCAPCRSGLCGQGLDLCGPNCEVCPGGQQCCPDVCCTDCWGGTSCHDSTDAGVDAAP
ncbi:MAG TPA: hypothetical protein VGQ83_20265 [Polyangia bacterium]|jgi:hypothetical protein